MLFANSLTLLTNVVCTLGSTLLLAQEGAGGPEPTAFQKFIFNPLTLPLGLFLIFYLTFLGPERRRKADEAKLLSSLQKNDRVVTIGGIHGTVVAVNDGIVTLKIDEGGSTRIKVNQSAIASKMTDKANEN